MTLDTTKLRSTANEATPDYERTLGAIRRAVDFYIANWYVRDDGTEARINPDGAIAKLLAFVEVASPSVVVGLLDEIESTSSQLKSAQDAWAIWQEACERTRSQLAAMTAARNELFEIFMNNRTALDSDTANRLSALRKVGQP